MTVLSWLLETITGALVVILWFCSSQDDIHDIADILMAVLYVSVTFIFIPASYLLNTDAIKDIIISQGWWKFIRTICLRSRRVEPAP